MFIILFFVGFVANVIGTLAGGGGLISLPTMLLLGMPVHSSIGANKVSNTIATLTSFITSFRRKEITIMEAWPIVAICFIGGVIGGTMASQFSEATLTIIALCFLLFAFIISFLGKTDFGENTKLEWKKRTISLLVGIGVYDGLFGPGSGTLALYVMAANKINYFKAVVYGRIAIFATCFGAAIIYISTGQILWTETLSLMVGSIIGAQVGIHIARKVNARAAKILLRAVTLFLILQLIADFFL